MTGANLCVPQLGIKVPYTPGTCAIIRGNGLEHLVQDYTGPRFFVIGTNHEACKKHAWRKLGRLPPLPPLNPNPLKPKASDLEEDEEDEEDSDDYLSDGPCINRGTDDDDEGNMEWTNEMLHGPRSLTRDPYSPTASSSSSDTMSVSENEE